MCRNTCPLVRSCQRSLLLLLFAVPATAFGQTIQIVGPTGDGAGNALVEPQNCEVDALGAFYTTGQGSDNAFRVDLDGTITEIIDATGDGSTALSSPRGIAIDATGNVYVAGFGSTSNAVFKIPVSGPIVVVLDNTGDGANTLDGPMGLAIDGSNLYVAGNTSDNVFKVDVSGGCSTAGIPCLITEVMDATGDGANGLEGPLGIGVDSAGDVIVVGYSSTNAFRIDTPGTCSTVGTPCTISQIIDATGGGGFGLSYPYALDISSTDDVYLTASWPDDSDFGNVFKVTPAGVITMEYSLSASGGVWLGGIEVDDMGFIFVSAYELDSGIAIRPDRTGSFAVIDASGDGLHPLFGPECVALASSGYLYFGGLDSNNVFRLTDSGLLPVELASFRAFVERGAVKLTWEVASEADNAGFHIQHGEQTMSAGHVAVSDDGERQWTNLSFVEGRGTSQEPANYAYMTERLDPGTHLFRLKQVGTDGSFTYSETIELVVEEFDAFLVKEPYPNPFNDMTIVTLVAPTDQPVLATLHDISGRAIRIIFSGDVKGHVKTSLSIAGSDLPSGTFLLRINGETFSESKSLTVIH